MSPKNQRRAEAASRVTRTLWCRVITPVTDKPNYELSLTKILSIAFATVDIHVIERSNDKLTWMHVLLAIVCMATAFGKSTFTFLLRRLEVKGSAALIEQNVKATIDQTITARRLPDLGFEPTP